MMFAETVDSPMVASKYQSLLYQVSAAEINIPWRCTLHLIRTELGGEAYSATYAESISPAIGRKATSFVAQPVTMMCAGSVE